MKTTTIYSAVEGTEHIWNPYGIDHGDFYPNQRVDRAERQCRKFYAELLRRMDAADEWRLTFPVSTPGEIVAVLSIHTATRGILDKRRVMR